ncbi:hypothetical protein OAP18_03180 [Gammaproteobacteria bacterium]|nr:hypothetical protein [Gammaproteobacteria bacterium]
MEPLDYSIAWAIYVVVGLVFSMITWSAFKKYLWRELAYLVQGLLLVIIFTPWYVLADQDVLAPAIIVFVMDTITIGGTAGVRALIPLVMAGLVSIVLTIILSIIYRVRKRKRKKV